MKYINIKQIHRIYFYIYIIKYINSQLQSINSNIYTYDSVGNKLTKQDSVGSHSYSYDNTYQLIQSTNPNETFAYDQVGNRNNTTVDAANKLLQDPNATYQYDANGNRYIKTQSDGTVVYYSYDYEGRLTRVESQKPGLTTIAVYKYDPLGRRFEKAVTENTITTTTRYLYDNEDIIAEYDVNGNITTKYIHGLGIDEPLAMEKNSNTYYYHADGLGSVVALTDNTGTVVQKYEYDSFGNIKSVLDPNFIQPFMFTGREYDSETGMYFYRERSYDQKTGTFISKDPIGFNAGDTNLYRYVKNNPVNYVDPLGLFVLSVKYSDSSYGSFTMVWNSWLPNFYTSGTRGDNGAEINSGIYKYKYGQHPMNPQNGKNPYPALNLYTLDDNRCISGTKLDKKGKTISENICGVNVHKGYTPKTGSQGCHVIPQKNWNNFISNFESESEGAYVYIRF